MSKRRMMTLPGLGLVGSDDDAALSNISDEAIESASSLMQQYSTVDQFLGSHAKAINELVESGAEINGAFVDRLLGLVPIIGSFTPPRGGISRQVSSQPTKEEEHIGMANMLSMVESSYETDGKKMDGVCGPSSFFKKKDQLKLSGLLNVLDGVVDSPGRISLSWIVQRVAEAMEQIQATAALFLENNSTQIAVFDVRYGCCSGRRSQKRHRFDPVRGCGDINAFGNKAATGATTSFMKK